MISWLSSSGQDTRFKYDILIKKTVPLLFVDQLSEKFQDTSKTILLDARSYREFEISHLPGAIWVGYDEFPAQSLHGLAKDAEVVVYCSLGVRSEKIAEQLIQMGFKDVKNLYGGLFEWKNSGKAVIDLQGQPTERVHAFSKIWGQWLHRGEKVYE